MLVYLDFLLTGARQAKGLAVVIDVFRAFSTAPYAIQAGAERIVPVATLDHARQLREEHPDWLLMGERKGVKPEGFDFGNAPTDFLDIDLAGRTLVHTTSAGTKGLFAAYTESEATEVVAASFVTAGAIIEHVRARNPEHISIIAMGGSGVERRPEDDLCGIYIKNALEDFPNSFEALERHLRTVSSAQKFFNPEVEWATEKDFEMIMALDAFDFVLRLAPEEDGVSALRPIAPGTPPK
jgi:2-phosphosulfolactate phosphatase